MAKGESERFWEKVEKTDGCWLWRAGLTMGGYGKFKLRGRSMNASRAVWIMERGPIDAGMFVCHRCDNPICVRPEHLFLGTPGDNTRDRDQKGRMARQKGESHGRHILTEEQVLEIRRRWTAGERPQGALAKAFGVCRPLISMIVNRKNWTHI